MTGDRQDHPEQSSSAAFSSFSESCRLEQTLVLGLWLMAVLTVEQSPDERGRIRALSLLHGASDAIRRCLEMDLDPATRVVCLEVYDCIEHEAKVLFQPMDRVAVPSDDSTPPSLANLEAGVSAKVNEWLSPMRQKRLYQERKRLMSQKNEAAPTEPVSTRHRDKMLAARSTEARNYEYQHRAEAMVHLV